jgi:hypothetical protein
MSRPQGDLELYSTEELIDELLNRTSFQGVLVHADQGVKKRTWDGSRIFKVRFNDNLSHDEAHRLLSVVSEHMQLHD